MAFICVIKPFDGTDPLKRYHCLSQHILTQFSGGKIEQGTVALPSSK